MRKRTKRIKILLFALLVFVLIAFIPTPYYLYQPGTVEELSAKVRVEDGYMNEDGSFHLTTILSSKATNPYLLIYGFIAPQIEVRKENEVQGHLTDKEYSNLLEYMMKNSKQNALVAAFTKARKVVEIEHHGIFVRNISSKSKAIGHLQVGDIITKVDGITVNEVADFTAYPENNKKSGDKVEVTFLRDGKERMKNIKIIPLESSTGKFGLGITPAGNFIVNLPLNVEIRSDDIGGPSAGLMFSLEIYNQLTPNDYTKGYKIAGTGSIDHKGNVGQIGGIAHKLAAAYREDVDIFFTPKDLLPGDTNEKEATKIAKEHESTMKIVPVATLSEAIEYLEKRKAK